MHDINTLWHKSSETQWLAALDQYRQYITRSEVALLDKELDPLDLGQIGQLDAEQWFEFLHNKYFPWKYTARNRLATTRSSLAKHKNRPNGLADLYRIKTALISAPVQDIERCLRLATEIGGLGVAGASGLLSLMHPEYFGTVDEFLVLALFQVHVLPEHEHLQYLENESTQASNLVVAPSVFRSRSGSC